MLLLAMAGCNSVSQPHQVTWSGDVDDTATVYFQDSRSWVDNVTGKPVQNINTVFQGELQPSSLITVKLVKTAGRGQVVIVQQPAKDNNFTAAVRIIDPEPAADHYQFTLKW
jgi:hypothetical protein